MEICCSVLEPVLDVRMKKAGRRTTTSTPLRRKTGVRFMIRNSRMKMAMIARRPEETRQDISSRVNRRRRPLVIESDDTFIEKLFGNDYHCGE